MGTGETTGKGLAVPKTVPFASESPALSWRSAATRTSSSSMRTRVRGPNLQFGRPAAAALTAAVPCLRSQATQGWWSGMRPRRMVGRLWGPGGSRHGRSVWRHWKRQGQVRNCRCPVFPLRLWLRQCPSLRAPGLLRALLDRLAAGLPPPAPPAARPHHENTRPIIGSDR